MRVLEKQLLYQPLRESCFEDGFIILVLVEKGFQMHLNYVYVHDCYKYEC